MKDYVNFWMLGVLDKAIRLWGKESQEIKAIEELAELTQAIVKNQQRHKKGNHRENLLEEIADVEIMLLQLKRINGFTQEEIEVIQREKVKRLDSLIDSITS